MTVTVESIFDNCVDNFVIASAETVSDTFGRWGTNTVLLSTGQDTVEMAESLKAVE